MRENSGDGSSGSGRQRIFGEPGGQEWGHEFIDLIVDNCIPVCAFNGTLLGLVREGALIEWDDDIDFVAPRTWFFSEDFEAFKRSLMEKGYVVRIKGFPLFPAVHALRNGYKASIASYAKIGQFQMRAPYRIPATLLSHKDFQKARVIWWRGTPVPVPHNAEKVLNFIYGSWQVPVRDTNGGESFLSDSFRNPPTIRRALQATNQTLFTVLRLVRSHKLTQASALWSKKRT